MLITTKAAACLSQGPTWSLGLDMTSLWFSKQALSVCSTVPI